MLTNGHPTALKLSAPAVRSRSNGHPSPSILFLPRPPHPHSAVSTPLRCFPPLLRPNTTIAPQMSFYSLSSAGNLTELYDESDFNAVSSPDGYLSICGFGSLLSEKSARSTLPDLKNFRVGVLRGFRRVFAHVAPIFFERGIANQETGEVSSLSVEQCEGDILIVTVFEIKSSEVPSFIKRENEFRFLAVVPESLDGKAYSAPAVVVLVIEMMNTFVSDAKNIGCKNPRGSCLRQFLGSYFPC